MGGSNGGGSNGAAMLAAGSPTFRPSARAGAGQTYIHKTPDRAPWAAVIRNMRQFRTICIHLKKFHDLVQLWGAFG